MGIIGVLGLGVYFRRLIGKSWIHLKGYIGKRRKMNLRAHFIGSEDEFFDRLEANAVGAKHCVDLTYFDNLPPKQSRTIRGQEYHNRFPDIVRRKPEVRFRRIVRENPSIITWVEQLIEEMEGLINVSLACYPDNEPDTANLGIITVQLIDDYITYLISIGTQQSSRAPRDVIVYSPEFNEMWSRYYNNLWEKSTVVLDRGILQQDKWQEIRRAHSC